MTCSHIPEGLIETLDRLAPPLEATGAAWMVFGGAALALHGIGPDPGDNLTPQPPQDIDILLSSQAAARLMADMDLENHAGAPSPRFRSRYLLRPAIGTFPVELIAGFQVADGQGDWKPVALEGWDWMRPGDQRIRVATRARLAALLQLFGRPKDLRRLAWL